MINKNCSKINDFVTPTLVQSSCSFVWRFEILWGDGIFRVSYRVSYLTGKNGSGLWDELAIDLVLVVKSESAPLNFWLTSLLSSSGCKIICCKYCTESSISLTR